MTPTVDDDVLEWLYHISRETQATSRICRFTI